MFFIVKYFTMSMCTRVSLTLRKRFFFPYIVYLGEFPKSMWLLSLQKEDNFRIKSKKKGKLEIYWSQFKCKFHIWCKQGKDYMISHAFILPMFTKKSKINEYDNFRFSPSIAVCSFYQIVSNVNIVLRWKKMTSYDVVEHHAYKVKWN